MTAGDTIPLLYFRQDQCYLISAEFSRLLRRQFFAVGLQNIDRDAHEPTFVEIDADVAEEKFGFAPNSQCVIRRKSVLETCIGLEAPVKLQRLSLGSILAVL